MYLIHGRAQANNLFDLLFVLNKLEIDPHIRQKCFEDFVFGLELL